MHNNKKGILKIDAFKYFGYYQIIKKEIKAMNRVNVY